MIEKNVVGVFQIYNGNLFRIKMKIYLLFIVIFVKNFRIKNVDLTIAIVKKMVMMYVKTVIYRVRHIEDWRLEQQELCDV